MRVFVRVCNLAGILGVSDSYTLQNGPRVPPYRTLSPHPHFLPPAQGKEKVLHVDVFVQTNSKLDTALGC